MTARQRGTPGRGAALDLRRAVLAVGIFALPRPATAQDPQTEPDAWSEPGPDADSDVDPSNDPSHELAALLELTDPRDPTYPGLLFRLATTTIDEAARLRHADEQGAGPEARLRQAHRERTAEALEQRALDALERLEGDALFRSYARRDEALFELAALRDRLDDREGMARAVLGLVRDYPTSDRIPAAYTLLADDYFDRGRYDHAERIYAKVLEFSDAAQVAYAHYKIAWCRLSPKPDRPADPAAAIEHFVRAMALPQAGPTGDALRFLARRDLVIAYAEVGKPGRARAFFERCVTGPQAPRRVQAMLERLADRYQALGRPSDAAVVRRSL